MIWLFIVKETGNVRNEPAHPYSFIRAFSVLALEPLHEISNNFHFECVDSDESLQPPLKLRHSKWYSVSS